MKNIDLKKALQLYLVTDHRLTKGRTTEFIVTQAVESGVTLVQLRDKGKSIGETLETGRRLRTITKAKKVPFLINDRCDICQALDADGVHLGQSDLPLLDARKVLGKDAIIGISVTTVAEGVIAERNGASYIAVNGVFATDTKNDLPGPLGLTFIKELHRIISVPVVAIGGIKPENTPEIIAAGCSGIAVVTGITLADDIRSACLDYLQAIASGFQRDKTAGKKFI